MLMMMIFLCHGKAANTAADFGYFIYLPCKHELYSYEGTIFSD